MINEPIYLNVCLPLCEGDKFIARQLLNTIEREIPQLNHKTGLKYMDTLPGYGGRQTIPVDTQTKTQSLPLRREGFKALIARLLFELAPRPRFYRVGWTFSEYETVQEIRLSFPVLNIGITVNPQVMNRRGWEPILLNFRGCYEPVKDILYWDRPPHLRPYRPAPAPVASGDPTWITTPAEGEAYFERVSPDRKPYTFPLTIREVLSLDPKNPNHHEAEKWGKSLESEPTPEQKRLDYEAWFKGDEIKPASPPPAPEPHNPNDFKD